MLLVLAFGKTSEERSKDISRLAFVSAELARAGAAVITAPSTPKEAARAALKETVLQSAGPGGNFFTIHVSTPLAACEERDRAGVYAAARRGELKGVPGVDEAFEAPAKADLTIDLTEESVSEAVTSEYPGLLRLLLTNHRSRHHPLARDECARLKCLSQRHNLFGLPPICIFKHTLL